MGSVINAILPFHIYRESSGEKLGLSSLSLFLSKVSSVLFTREGEKRDGSMFPKRSPPLTRDIRYFLEMYFVVSRDTRVDRIDVFDPRREDVRIDLRDSIPTMEKLRTSRFRGMDEHASSRVRCREVLLVLAVSPYDISLSLSLSSTPTNPCETRQQRCPPHTLGSFIIRKKFPAERGIRVKI